MKRPTLCTFGGLKEGDLYIERPADRELLDALQRGEYAYVLSSRQTGKTSLMLRTLRKLRAAGVRCAKLDLGTLGSEAGPETFYASLATEIADALGEAEEIVDACFSQKRRGTPVQRLVRLLREIIGRSESPLVLFVDEIEGFLKLPMRTADDFLAALRTLYNERDREPRYRRLSVCLMGVCTPTELIRDERRTPFNVARGISLDDFRWDEVRAGFLPALAEVPNAEVILQRVFAWTNGHPYLTHRLVRDWVQQAETQEPGNEETVDRIVREQFLSGLGREQENFLEVERRLLLGPAHRARQRLALYQAIRRGQSVPARGRDPIQLELRLTGLIAERRSAGSETVLAIRNRILAELFDAAWAPKSDPAKLDPAVWMKEQTERWQDFDRKDAFVLRGEELQEAQVWSAAQPTLDPAVREFVAASERADSHERAIRLYSLLWTLLWSSFTNFLLVLLLPEYWRHQGYPAPGVLKALYGLPFVLALPSGIWADRARIRPATMLLGGLGLITLGLATLLGDWIAPGHGLVYMAILLVLVGQVLQRPHVAVLVGLLYPRSDRRLDLTFLAYYVFVNLGALLGPLVGAAAFKQYGWPGLLATAATGSSFAFYALAASRRVFRTPNLPLRTEPVEPTDLRARRRRAVLILTVTLMIFWTAFYALGSALQERISRDAGPAAESGLRTGNLLAQGLYSEAITPLFVLGIAPVIAALTYVARRRNIEPTAPTKIALGMLTLSALLVAVGTFVPGSALLLGAYVVLTLAELLVVPASMSMTTALSPSNLLSAMMGGYFLVMGLGAWWTDLYVRHPARLLPGLAVLTALAAAMLVIRRRSWAGLFPSRSEPPPPERRGDGRTTGR